MKKLSTYIVTLLLCLYIAPTRSSSLEPLGILIDASIASVSNTIILSTHAAYQKLKLRNKIKDVIASLQKNKQTYAQRCQKKLTDKYHETIRDLCNHLNINSKMFIDHMNSLCEHDVHELSLPLAKHETAAIHSEKIPVPLLELIVNLLRKFNINPDRVRIDVGDNEFTVYVKLIDSTTLKRHYGIFISEPYLKTSLFEMEGTIIHELTHIILGHLLLEASLVVFTNKNIKELTENDPKLIISNCLMNIMHAREYMADLYFAVTNPMHVLMLKQGFKSDCLYSLEGLFQTYETHPTTFSRIKKLQKAALYLDYEHQSKNTNSNA